MEVRKSSRTTSLGYSWCWVRHPYRLQVGKWIARHTYLDAHRRGRCYRGVLFWSGFSLAAHALPSSPRLPSLAWRGANELTPRCYLGPDGQCDSSSSTREQGSHDASSDDAGDDSTRLA